MAHELQGKFQSFLDNLVVEGKERGAQIVIYKDGRQIVDAWAGMADVRTGRAVDGDTLFPVFSTTKGIVATMIHLLAERGQIDYDTPIAHYWSEFAANGKEGITVRHALNHTSGIQHVPAEVDDAVIADWQAISVVVAQLKPVSAPGEKNVYHSITYGWILGEVARRVDGRPVSRFIAEEIAGPLGLKTLFVGIPEELEPKVAFLEEFPAPATTPVSVPSDVAPCMSPLSYWMNRREARIACVPGANGIMNARAVARHYAALVPGGVDDVELLPPERIRLATREEIPGNSHRLGYGPVEGSGFGHGGHGGSMGYAIPAQRLAVGITRNRFSDYDLRGHVILMLREAFGGASAA